MKPWPKTRSVAARFSERHPRSETPFPQRAFSPPRVMEQGPEDAPSVSRSTFSIPSTVIDNRDTIGVADAVRSYQPSRRQVDPPFPESLRRTPHLGCHAASNQWPILQVLERSFPVTITNDYSLGPVSILYGPPLPQIPHTPVSLKNPSRASINPNQRFGPFSGTVPLTV